jgi:hypothetical protein
MAMINSWLAGRESVAEGVRAQRIATYQAVWKRTNVIVRAAELAPDRVETVVLAANQDGLRFATRLGFVEHDRYTLGGDTAEWVDLHLA